MRLIGGVPGTEGVQNGVNSNVYEGKIKAKKGEEEGKIKEGKGRKEEKKKRRKEKGEKKRMRDSLDLGRSDLSHFEGDFLKF